LDRISEGVPANQRTPPQPRVSAPIRSRHLSLRSQSPVKICFNSNLNTRFSYQLVKFIENKIQVQKF
jgi:hypothetical protein